MRKLIALVTLPLGFFAVVASAIAQSDHDVKVTLHNEYGHTVLFSCNDSQWRELQPEESRNVWVHPEDGAIHCSATHDGEEVWHYESKVKAHRPVALKIEHRH